MKIIDARTFVVANPPPSFGGRYWVFLKLVTDSGVVGYGEAYSLPFHPGVVAGDDRRCLRSPRNQRKSLSD